jgi:hypothetical protein
MTYPVVKVVSLKDSLLSKHNGKSSKGGFYTRPRFKHFSATKRFESSYNRIPMKRSPYLGYLRHAPQQTHFHNHSILFQRGHMNHHSFLVEKSSPYVGFMRHAPPSSCQVSSRISHSCTLKGDLIKLVEDAVNKNDDNYALPRKGKRKFGNDQDVLMSMRYRELSTFISGHLPGGGNISSYYSFCKMYIESDLPSRRPQENDLEATFEMFHRLASWFLFPVAYDQRSTCSFSNIRDDAYMEHVRQGFSLIYSLIKRILPGRETMLICTGLQLDGDNLIPQHVNSSGLVKNDSEITIEDLVENNSTANDRDSKTSHLPQNHPLHVSVSSLAKAYHLEQAQSDFFNVHSSEDKATMSSEEIQRHLDIDSILRLPIITYHSPKAEEKSEEEINVEKEGKRQMDLEWSWVSVPQDPQCNNEEENYSKSENKADVNLSEEEKGNHQDQSQEHCVICIEQFQDGDRLRVLPCEHRFHTSCIDKWLSGSYSHEDCFTGLCPTCKKKPNIDILSNSSSFEVDEDDSMGTMGDDMRIEGIVPSWAFTRLGGSIAKEH